MSIPPPQAAPPPAARVHAYDGLRGLLALAVVFSHVAALQVVPFRGAGEPRGLLFALWQLGAPSVDAFFVLSGLVVTQSSLRRGALLPFYLARFRRLYPLGVIGALLGVLVARPVAALIQGTLAPAGLLPILREPLTPGDLRGAFSMGLLGIFEANRLNPPLWTLAVEVYASLLLPGLIAAARRLGWWALPLSLPVFFVAGLRFYPLIFMPMFLLGALLAVKPVQVPRRGLIPLLILGLALLFSRHLTGSEFVLTRWVTALGAAGVLLALRDLDPPLLRAGPLQWLGAHSYALYAAHLPVLVLGVWALGPLLGVPLAAAAFIPLSVGAAWAAQTLVKRLGP